MKYRLDAQHYINDRLLEPGHIIGDETDCAFVNADGSPMEPSMQMTPLDGDAKSAFEKRFPNTKLPKSALDNISLKMTEGGQVRQAGGPVDTVDGVPGGYVIGPDGEPTKELKKGLPDSGSPNHPVGQPVIGVASVAPAVGHKPEDPAYRVAVPAAEAKAVSDAQAKAQSDAAKPQAAHPPTPQEIKAKQEQEARDREAAAKAKAAHEAKKV